MSGEDMRGMNDSQIERVFGALSRIETKIDNHTDWMTAHVAEDKLMAADITAIKLASARQKGFLTALAGAGSLVAGIVGYVIEFFVSGRGHH